MPRRPLRPRHDDDAAPSAGSWITRAKPIELLAAGVAALWLLALLTRGE